MEGVPHSEVHPPVARESIPSLPAPSVVAQLQGCRHIRSKIGYFASSTITKDDNAGYAIALDHILPIALVPEPAARFFNLEVVPARENLAKSARLTDREVSLPRRWHREGLLSAAGLKAVD